MVLYPNWSVKTKCAALGVDIATVIKTLDIFNQLFKQNIERLVVVLSSISGKHLIPYQTIFLPWFRAGFQKWASVLTKATVRCINRGGWILEPFVVLCSIQ